MFRYYYSDIVIIVSSRNMLVCSKESCQKS